MSVMLYLILAAVIIIALTAYAIYSWRLVFKQKKAQAEALKVTSQQQCEAEDAARVNILTMLRVVEQGQVSVTEAAIRIMSYRLALPVGEQQQAFFKPFDELALATAHIPILDNWKALTPSQQQAFDDERSVLELRYQADIDAAVATYLSSHS
ncbi:DUF2489 domain-containing protein [Dasania marina]|uniref:DUF2489 domain-containing protein n=1 Tax=Dasania marina TaxID=471499 RepID=UPI0030DCD2A0